MRYYTWDGCKLFRKIETAATWCKKNDANPYDLKALVDGRTGLADDWEVIELLRFMYESDYDPKCDPAFR